MKKSNGFEPDLASALVRDTSVEMAEIVDELDARVRHCLPGKCLPGKCLPGKCLVVYDYTLDMAIDVFPGEDGHAQERSLLSNVLLTVKANDLWKSDRNFCVQDVVSGIYSAGGFYAFRLHGKMPVEFIGKEK